MDRKLAKDLRPVLQAHLDKIDLSGIGGATVAVLNAKFDAASVTFQVKITPGGEAALADKAKADFEEFAAMYGLKPEHFGATFRAGGREYKVAGLNPGRSRFPISAVRSDGKRFKFEARVVLQDLDPELAAARARNFAGLRGG
jgi:hypothetical protein